MNKRFIIASGGTGGHFYPGLALGKALKQRGGVVMFLVRKNDPAIPIIEKNRLRYREIDFMGLPRSLNPLRQLRFSGKFFKSLLDTRRIIKKFHPDVAMGMGGYISFPLIFTAYLMHIKTAVHDSNARMGLANRVCEKFARLFMLGLPMKKCPKNSKLMSTPIRPEFAEDADREALLKALKLDPKMKTVLVVGGSQGAQHLNEAVAQAAKTFTKWQFIHITGERWFGPVRQLHGDNPRVAVLPYSHEIYNLMKIADAAICRSGASTLAELIYCQLPAVLVPYPHAAANHQYYNAKILADRGCAFIVNDDESLVKNLQTEFAKLDNPRKLSAMRYAFLWLRLPSPINAARNIARMLLKL